MVGHRAIHADGWKAVTRHTPGVSFDDDQWELYDLGADPSECHDLAAEQPDRLAELVELWWVEAERAGVLPLDDRGVELFGVRFGEHLTHSESRRYTYRPPMSALPAQSAAAIAGRSFTLLGAIDREAGQGGVLYAMGNGNSGLVIDGERCGSVDIPFVMRVISSVGSTVGYDGGLPVSTRYTDSFPFEGTLHRVDIELLPFTKREAVESAETQQRADMTRQ